MVRRDDGDHVDAVGTRGLLARHVAVVGVAAFSGDVQLGRARRSARGVGR